MQTKRLTLPPPTGKNCKSRRRSRRERRERQRLKVRLIIYNMKIGKKSNRRYVDSRKSSEK